MRDRNYRRKWRTLIFVLLLLALLLIGILAGKDYSSCAALPCNDEETSHWTSQNTSIEALVDSSSRENVEEAFFLSRPVRSEASCTFTKESLKRMISLMQKSRRVTSSRNGHIHPNPKTLASGECGTSRLDAAHPVQSKINKSSTQNPAIPVTTRIPTVEEKIEYVERHFDFQGFVENPLEYINSLESRHIFEMVSIPKPVLTYIARRRCGSVGAESYCRGQVKKLLDELTSFDTKGRRYSQVDIRQSFEKWKSTIKEVIRAGGNRIEVAQGNPMNRAAEELMGPYIRNLLFEDRDDLQNESASSSPALDKCPQSTTEYVQCQDKFSSRVPPGSQ